MDDTGLNEKIAALWNEGVTSGDIAARLHMTRNAIMGRISRMRRNGAELRTVDAGLADRIREAAEIKQRRQAQKEALRALFASRAPKKAQPVAESVLIRPPALGSVTILQLRLNSCRYITSEHSDESAIYCGAYADRPPYCPEHAALCYLPAKPRKREAARQAGRR